MTFGAVESDIFELAVLQNYYIHPEIIPLSFPEVTLAQESGLKLILQTQVTNPEVLTFQTFPTVVGRQDSRLDYGCSTLASLPANTISRLQSVLNAAARLVFSSRKHHCVSPLLQRLHWLKMEQRIEYKLALLAYRSLHGLAPPYLANELQPLSTLDTPRRPRSATTNALVLPPTRLSTVGDRLSLLPQLGCGTACQFRLHQQQPSARSSSG